MARPPHKNRPPRQADDERGARKRRSPLTDFIDASEPLHGFGESPQPELSGTPLSGSIADWAEEIAREAEISSPPEVEVAAKRAERVDRGSEPTSRKDKSFDDQATPPGRPAAVHPPLKGEGKTPKRIPERSSAPTRTGRGTSMGGAASAKERASVGLNPVAGLDVSLEEADALNNSGVTATVAALSKLIEGGNPLHKDGQLWVPHRPERPEKSEGGIAIKMVSDYEPAGDQPTAIADLVEGIDRNDRNQVLLGVTGSGKTFTMAKVIEATQRPALILAPNKTLAAQLYGEFKNFFPDNAVEYFVSYYDYYQPEAYVPRTDTYIEKESSINEQIDRMRHSATRSLLERDDVVIVASVSCIYGIGSVETYTAMTFQMTLGDRLDQRQLLADLVAQQYKRQDINFVRGSFRVRGDTIEIFPAHLEDRAWRISMFGDEIDAITEFDPLTGQKTGDLKSVKIYANSHYVTPRPTLNQAIKSIREELRFRLAELERAGRLLEAQRLEQRTRFDLEMLEATGSCAGIENYSRYLTGRQPGEPPPTLFEYIPDNAIIFVDESHQTIPQIGGMYRGDFRRKATLAEYGFRLPSCMDNRPLRFEEWDAMRPATVAVSATPGKWEMEEAGGVFAEQVIRPTGLIDPPVEVRPAKAQVDDVVGEIRETTRKGYRTLVTVLTKRMAEDLTEYLHENGIRVRYMHSDVETLERIEIIRDLRLGAFDVLVGINLLREGLDLPEVSLVGILDADKEGFLRSETSLIQTIGRAARNVDGKVVLYADQITGSMERAMVETSRRREKQAAWNAEHGITPESVKSRIADILDSVYEKDHVRADIKGFAENEGALIGNNLKAHLEALEKQMRDAAADLDFERAARLRDEIKRLREAELEIADDPLARDVERESPASGREKGRHNKGRERHRTVDSGGSLFAKPDLDQMGTSGDHAEPAGAIPRSLFKKQSAREAHGSDFGIPEDERARSLFRKNTLDEMTVRRTEKPVEGVKPRRPDPSRLASLAPQDEGGGPESLASQDPGIGHSHGEDASRPHGEVRAQRASNHEGDSIDDPKPIRRERAGLGSYEDPADERNRGRRSKKTGRPGQ